jgi:hypothetical protein
MNHYHIYGTYFHTIHITIFNLNSNMQTFLYTSDFTVQMFSLTPVPNHIIVTIHSRSYSPFAVGLSPSKLPSPNNGRKGFFFFLLFLNLFSFYNLYKCIQQTV